MTKPVPEDKIRLGGMALRNGLLVHGPTHWVAAVRTKDGEVKVASGRKPRLAAGLAERVPGVRGVLKLGEALAVVPLVKSALPEGRDRKSTRLNSSHANISNAVFSLKNKDNSIDREAHIS